MALPINGEESASMRNSIRRALDAKMSMLLYKVGNPVAFIVCEYKVFCTLDDQPVDPIASARVDVSVAITKSREMKDRASRRAAPYGE